MNAVLKSQKRAKKALELELQGAVLDLTWGTLQDPPTLIRIMKTIKLKQST